MKGTSNDFLMVFKLPDEKSGSLVLTHNLNVFHLKKQNKVLWKIINCPKAFRSKYVSRKLFSEQEIVLQLLSLVITYTLQM